jgi:hypothetical protein
MRGSLLTAPTCCRTAADNHACCTLLAANHCTAHPEQQNLADGSAKYDFVEVMACPGGCIGGGGQPRSADKQILPVRVLAARSPACCQRAP